MASADATITIEGLPTFIGIVERLLEAVSRLEKLQEAAPGMTIHTVEIPDDAIIVLRHPMMLNQAAYKNLSLYFKEHWPGRKLLILEEGMEMQIAVDATQQEGATCGGRPPCDGAAQ